MWHPTGAIRHALPEPGWPTETEAAKARLFQPIRLGPISLEQRTWVPAMVPWRATDEGFVTEEVLEWYARFAQGRPGAIVVEATGIRDVPSGPLLRIGHDRFLPGLEKLVETVRKSSGGHTRLLIQIIDFLSIRRRPEPEKFFRRFLQITDAHREHLPGKDDAAIREALMALPEADLGKVLTPREMESLRQGERERVTDTHLTHIRELPKVLPGLFSGAAVRAGKAGFDGVELHYAHAYTMSSFLSALNDRDDGYGRTREGRLRLPLEVFAAVKAAAPKSVALGCRFLSEDCVPGGSTLEDSAFFAAAFVRAGMDFLSLSRGGRFEDAEQPKIGQAAYPYTGRSGWECMPTALADAKGPFGRNVEASGRIRAAVRASGFQTPIVVSGGIGTFAQAEDILAHGEADIVGAARQSLADPDWFLKTRLGHGAEIRRCTYTNYCEGLDQLHKQVTCKLWDRQGIDAPGVRLSDDGRRRLVAP